MILKGIEELNSPDDPVGKHWLKPHDNETNKNKKSSHRLYMFLNI